MEGVEEIEDHSLYEEKQDYTENIHEDQAERMQSQNEIMSVVNVNEKYQNLQETELAKAKLAKAQADLVIAQTKAEVERLKAELLKVTGKSPTNRTTNPNEQSEQTENSERKIMTKTPFMGRPIKKRRINTNNKNNTDPNIKVINVKQEPEVQMSSQRKTIIQDVITGINPNELDPDLDDVDGLIIFAKGIVLNKEKREVQRIMGWAINVIVSINDECYPIFKATGKIPKHEKSDFYMGVTEATDLQAELHAVGIALLLIKSPPTKYEPIFEMLHQIKTCKNVTIITNDKEINNLIMTKKENLNKKYLKLVKKVKELKYDVTERNINVNLKSINVIAEKSNNIFLLDTILQAKAAASKQINIEIKGDNGNPENIHTINYQRVMRKLKYLRKYHNTEIKEENKIEFVEDRKRRKSTEEDIEEIKEEEVQQA